MAIGVVAMVVIAVIDYRRLRELRTGRCTRHGARARRRAVAARREAQGRAGLVRLRPVPAAAVRATPSSCSSSCLAVVLRGCIAATSTSAGCSTVLFVARRARSALIMLQPDLGTDLVLIAHHSWRCSLVAGARPRHLVDAHACSGIVGVVAVVQLRRAEGVPDRPARRRSSNPRAGRRALRRTTWTSRRTRSRTGGLTGQGPVRRHADQPLLRARAAHRLHLHRRGRGARVRRRDRRCSRSSR